MPIVGLGLHFLAALFFAVHALRTGQPMYWLIILFSFPVLGSIVYLFAIYLPGSRLQYDARRAVATAARVLDPTRELREARAAYDYTPTAQNQMRLAAALLDAGQAQEAAENYEACMKGPFASDLDMQLGAARAQFACERYGAAAAHLDAIRKENRDFRPEQVSLLLAQSLAGMGHNDAARAEYEFCVTRHGSFEAKAEFAIWAMLVGERELAERLQTELERSMARWNRYTRKLNAPILERLRAARATAAKNNA